ncbi:hypothetical protein EBB59_03640 [Lysobacter pythonis]|uniref:DUF2189 domain-containing protein n=1 Tax=Solilutibacter pythonis TaxID=2483112 RepID=A0A3M2I657_9GAMM|nr:hypothetical protein EBB59_03640 [Lysobacter pythonis]
MPPAQAWRWFIEAINLGVRNPRAIFGAALLLVGSLYLIVIGGGLLAGLLGGAGGGEPGTLALALTLLTVVAVFLLVPVLVGGLMHVIREAEAGRPVRARDIYGPLRGGRGGRLAAFGGLQIVAMAAGLLLTRHLAGEDYMAAYNEAVNAMMRQQQPVPLPTPAHPLLLFLWQLVFNYFTATVMLLGIALVALSGLGFVDAAKAAARAALRNLAPNVLAAGLFFGAVMVAVLLLSVVGSVLLLVLGKLFMPLALLVGLVFTLAFISAVLVVICGGGYLIWRDTFGDAERAQAPRASTHIEV